MQYSVKFLEGYGKNAVNITIKTDYFLTNL